MRIACLFMLLPVLASVGAADLNIIVAAKISTEPEADPTTLLHLVDGRLNTHLTFAIKTAGEGTVTFTFDHLRRVSAVRLYQGHGAYYSTAYLLEADTTGDGVFDKLLVEVRPAKQTQWAEHAFAPLNLKALRFRSLEGFSHANRAHPCLAEFEILGQPQPGDLQKANELGVPIAYLPAVRPLVRETALVTQGRGPAILAPADAAYRPAVQRLQELLAPFNPQLVANLADADPAARTVICLGNMLTNPLLERLYWNHYTFVDALTPGPGNYLLHTVYDPYPWNGGHNVIVLGCSDPTGALPAVEAFAGRLQQGSLPYGVLTGPRPLVSEAEASRVAAAKVNPTFEDFLKSSTRYLQTGCEAHAQQAVKALELVAQLYAPDGERRDPQVDKHTQLPWNEETQSFAITCAWDAFEEHPLINDPLRLQASNAFLHFTRDLVSRVAGYNAITRDNPWPEYNHTTFPLLGIYGGARYFQRYYQIADMPDKLQRAHYAFKAQANSWKAPEDSDAYLPLVPDHTLTYALAENDLTYLTSGNLQKYADYVVGIVDNQGLGSGFGDSGFSSTPSQISEALPRALWWTKDPGYLWLLQHFLPGWKNPFASEVKPQRPDRFTGLNIFAIDPRVYERVQTRPTYNEFFTKAEVSREEAFDKVSFRDSWDPGAQYLLLDGIGRGHHLHFDTNQIVEFVESGERWLLDHDYLIRNTTEHNMLTVLRNGRGDTLVPSLAALSAQADLPGFAYTDSSVRNYNGCDWRRQILWQRGESFLIADTVTAREAGEYDLELTWKTIDHGGDQKIVGNGELLAQRGAGTARTQNCLVVEDPEASSGQTLIMEQPSARVCFGADLPPGDYRLKIIGYGADGSSDSLWVSVNHQPNIAFHMPKLKYGSSAGDAQNTAESPRVTLAGQGPHSFIITLRERPPVRIDRFVFVDAQGRETVYQAEALPPAPKPTTDLSRNLLIRPALPVQAFVTNHDRQGISVPVSIYHQRRHVSLQPRQTTELCSLMYTSLPAKRRDLRPVRLAANLFAIQGTHPALALLGPVRATGLQAEAAAGLLGAEAIALSGLTQLQMGELRLQADRAIDLQLDLKSGRGVVEAGQATRLTIGSQSIACAAGKHPLTVKLPSLPRMQQALARLLAARPASGAALAAPAASHAQPTWSTFKEDAEIAVLKTADLQQGAGPCLLVGRGPFVHCLDPQGRLRWQVQTGGKVTDLAAADLRPEPGLEILVGSTDTYLYLVSATGEILARHQMRGKPWARSFGDNPYALYNVGAWDITGDGQLEIVATMKNFDLQVLDHSFKLLFRSDWALHGSRQLSFEATKPSGPPDTLFVGDKYGSVVGINGQGKVVFRSYTSIGDVFYGVGDITGDGQVEVINASSTGDLTANSFTGCKLLWRFDNFGYPTNRVKLADLDDDGKQEVLVASGTGYLYVLTGEGQVRWQDRLGMGINDVLVVERNGRPHVAYADECGLIRLADGSGKLIQQWATAAPPRLLAVQGDLLCAALADGRLVAFGL